ncbi:MAG: aminoacyl-tRNA hydrolase [Patescibacteria group bacterium]|nr:aminoacyl-tRNA hydrolase [Patescibacteria group bacterium]
MKIFIGLGNPGKKYQKNRHNVGKLFIHYLINELTNLKEVKLKNNNKIIAKIFLTDDLIFVRSEEFMNLSGKLVSQVINNFKLSTKNLYIVHDDLDIPLGKFKFHFAEGPKLHKGIKSVEESLRTKDFWRIRIGIDNRKKEAWIKGEIYVLENFLPEEKQVLQNQVFPKIFGKIKKQL